MNIAIIPARGGSKRIPRKNIKEFCGKPMIAWSVEAAQASGCFDRIIVSTDDFEIAGIAELWGAEVPFMRPEILSDDYTGTIPVMRHALEWLHENGCSSNYACCIYATAPFLSVDDLINGRQLVGHVNCDYAFSVTSYAFPIQRAVRLSEEGRVSMFQPEHFKSRSQDLEEAYHDAGQFYWGSTSAWKREIPVFSERSAVIILPRERVQDIDTFEDWSRAEWLFKAMQGGLT